MMTEADAENRNTGAGGTTGNESGSTTGAGGATGNEDTGAESDAPASNAEDAAGAREESGRQDAGAGFGIPGASVWNPGSVSGGGEVY